MQTKAKLSTKHIYEFYRYLEEKGVENHGLLIVKEGETLFEEYAYPYSENMPHTLFSVTKSIVSTAVGFAISEGLLSLDTKIEDIFPEYEKCKGDQWQTLTVRSVLTMQSNKEFTFLQDMTGDYVEMFMKAPFRKKGGFLYSNNDAHICAAAVQKVTGMSLVEYLTPRLFEPLGIDIPFWETNNKGECIGGTGCYLKLRDLVKIMLCYSQGGRYEGQQIIPEFWTEEATKIQVKFNGKNGYGYLFWINGSIYSMTGMYGQIIAYSKKHNAVLGSFNCAIDEEEHTYALHRLSLKLFSDTEDEEYTGKLSEYLEKRKEKPIECITQPRLPFGKELELTKASKRRSSFLFPQSIIPRTITCSLAKRPKTCLNRLSFTLDEKVLTVKWYEEEDLVEICCGLDGEPRLSECSIKGYPYKLWAYAYTEGEKVKIVCRILNTLATRYITIENLGDSLTMTLKGTPDFKEFLIKNATSPDFVKKHSIVKKATEGFVGGLANAMDKPLIFK